MAKRPPKIKIMVASSIYGFEDQLDQICATLAGYGYDVLSSHWKKIPADPDRSNLDICLEAVEQCDVFFGIIRPQYGSGVIGDLSITHQEMRKAIELKKPRWFIAHRDITIARQLLRQYMFDKDGKPNLGFTYKRTNVIDDIRLIDLYNETILNEIPPADRIGHWVDEYFRLVDILRCIETQFYNISRVRDIVERMKK